VGAASVSVTVTGTTAKIYAVDPIGQSSASVTVRAL